jgi:hypothetical protein
MDKKLRARSVADWLRRLSKRIGNWFRVHKTMSPQLVWYASYGSNLCLERFLTYIEGGKLDGTDREYTGCTDKTLPRQSRSLTVRHQLFFACRSPLWNGAAMAFVREAESNCRTFGRMYLITDDHPKCYLNRQDPSRSSPTDTRCSYGMILNLGAEDGHSILTFTAVGPDAEMTARAPSREYLQFIARGIREAFPDTTAEQIRWYFLVCDGVRGRISEGEVRGWLSGL